MARGDQPPGHADEVSMLLSFLDQYREIIIWKIEDLDETQARWRPALGANSLLNLLVHLTGVERRWSQQVIAGEQIERDRDAEFGERSETVPEAIDAYRKACARTNEIARAMSPDDTCAGDDGYSVRWVLVHLIEEVARHAGHADITRQLLDGKVGLSPAYRE